MSTIIIIVFITIGVSFFLGFIFTTRKGGETLNTYEYIYDTYTKHQFKIKELDLEHKKEETEQLRLRIELSDKIYKENSQE